MNFGKFLMRTTRNLLQLESMRKKSTIKLSDGDQFTQLDSGKRTTFILMIKTILIWSKYLLVFLNMILMMKNIL